MSEPHLPEEFAPPQLSLRSEENEASLNSLVRAIRLSEGQFSLILAGCNYVSLRQQVVQQMKELLPPIQVREVVLAQSVKTLYTTIQTDLGDEQPGVLMVFGLESVRDLDTVLTATNQVREEFSKNFSFPLVLWINDEIQKKLIRLVTDIESWSTTHKFTLTNEDFIDLLRQSADQIFAKILEVGAGRFLHNAALNLVMGSQLRLELESAVKDLQNRGEGLEPALEASLQFIRGRDAYAADQMEAAREHYEQSLAFWQESGQLERQGCLLFHMGLWWRRYATLHRPEYELACEHARDYFQQCIECFRQANRPDLVAKFINALGEVLQQIKQWDELERQAQSAVDLHQTYPDSIRLAYAYGLLGEVALGKGNWTEAKRYAELALQTNAQTSELAVVGTVREAPLRNPNPELTWAQQHYPSWYRFLLAQAQRQLTQLKETTQNLETAKNECIHQFDPPLYIRILEALRSLYYEQGHYLEAFRIKQEKGAIEHLYKFRAFIGAGRLQAQQQLMNPALVPVESYQAGEQLGFSAPQTSSVAEEIAASGRQQDINRLIERMGRHDHKLTVIYGPSGVGKSSILQAGLVPTLKEIAIGERDALPVLLQVYADWGGTLGRCLGEAYEEGRGKQLSVSLDSTAEILEELRKNAEQNLLTVLIFDQFEEFFFVYKDQASRRPFYEFLRACLEVPFVKVILSLREDYLNYLLEFNRLTDLKAIENNVLDKNILYYLGNFSPEDAKAVIKGLTRRSQFYLEPDLIHALVEDLSGGVREVRPIELQVVGAQLQAEKITTLAQYQEHGPKQRLVEQFLEEVVKDCGSENEQIANLILYLLTDENNTRPLKTRADLELELDIKDEKLDLVLAILVQSGLVLKVPAFPSERYQLVHDYLVPFVRQQQSAQLIAELEKEREQRRLTEAKLNRVLKQQLQTARRATFTLAGLLVLIGGFAVISTIVGINLYLINISSSLGRESQLEFMMSRLNAGKRLKQFSLGAIPGSKLKVLTQLNQAVYMIQEVNHLKGHEGTVTSVSFSPDDSLLATVSEDKTVNIWSINGEKIKTLKGHKDSVTSVSFTPNSKLIATASKDKTVKLWRIIDRTDRTPIKNILGHKESITSISFSYDGKLLASASEDKTVKLWNLDGGLIKTLKGHTGSVKGVSFSPDGEMLASADDDTVKLWSIDGKSIRSIDNYGTVNIRFSSNGKTLVLTNKDQTIKTYNLNGLLLKNISIPYANNVESSSIYGNLLAFVSPLDSKLFHIVKSVQSQFLNISGFHNDTITYLSFSNNGRSVECCNKTLHR